ncbi:hypothetical protein CSA56_14070 [candidate division KSB3 bacterium]|uniref:Uncharacterized protein n=1 Tax=candidate division KSB3 bacterium TaxID=2044937 RepID=A0A2G6KDE1_9BACT|nr:MAG: hypothetical protein CSA56_14070 [candidate division KSB3 bacterium]
MKNSGAFDEITCKVLRDRVLNDSTVFAMWRVLVDEVVCSGSPCQHTAKKAFTGYALTIFDKA